MELNKFVKESLVQIVEGLNEANQQLKKDKSYKDNSFLLSPGSRSEDGDGVFFDVAITTHTEQTTDGKAKVRLTVFEAGVGGDDKITNQSISRIQFTIHVNHWIG